MAKIKHAPQIADLPKPYHTAAMAEIEKQTDQGAAIVGAAYIDLVVREALTARMGDLPDIVTLLFDNRGPLQDFGARIQLAFAIGIIGHGAYTDLCIIKDVRNAFAHSAEAMDFDHAGVTARCSGLWFAKTILYDKRPKPSTAKERFIRTIELLADGLHENIMRHKAGLSPSQFLTMGPSSPKAASKSKPPKRIARGVDDSERAEKLLQGVKGKRLTYQTTHC